MYNIHQNLVDVVHEENEADPRIGPGDAPLTFSGFFLKVKFRPEVIKYRHSPLALLLLFKSFNLPLLEDQGSILKCEFRTKVKKKKENKRGKQVFSLIASVHLLTFGQRSVICRYCRLHVS